MELLHASLFSGIGGFDLAAEWTGWQNAFHCEINPFCQRVLKHHFPNSKSYADITKTDFREWRGRIFILTGGFPCQPFSLAGKRKGAEDDRYLWPQMLRAIREVHPAWVVGENVAGIATMVQPGETVEVGSSTSLFGESYKDEELRQQYVVETVCRDLEREGYSVQPLLIPACAVGAPHRRDRVWFIAHRDGDRCRERTDKQNPVTGCNPTPDNSNGGTNGNITYTTDTGAETLQRERQDRVYAVGASADTTCKQGERYRLEQPGSCEQEQGELGRSHCETSAERGIPGWRMFPTQSPVCSRNDGLSSRLDGITFPKWREESVKAYGNAIVPQVAYEIFKAINEL